MRGERLQKILSAAGVASRRAAEALILQGRVSVNGEVVAALGTRADPAADDIRVDGRRLARPAHPRHLLLNKPPGYVTTRSDPQGRPTVLDLLPRDIGYLYPVGRLDYASAGLLLLTNDGDLAARLMHPSHEVERAYHATVAGAPDAGALARLRDGVALDGRRTAPAAVRVLATWAEHGRPLTRLELVLREGRNRQVRRMCEAVGHPVRALERVRIGPVHDARLARGAWRDLTSRELAALRRAAGAGP
jgi:23S rRNA pseudouridine2605 synthase